MCGLLASLCVLGRVVIALPVDQVIGQLSVDALPPNIAIVGQCDVGEDRVGARSVHCHRVGLVRSTGGNTEEASLGVDGVQAAIRARTHPCDVVANGFYLVALDGRLQHCQVGLATCRRERGGDVVLVASCLFSQAQDQHVLCHPAVAAAHGRRNTQSEALLAQQCVSAVTGTVGPDLVGFGEVSNVLLVIARPSSVFLALFQRSTNGVNCGNPRLAFGDQIQCLGTHAGHDAHRADYVRRVSNFDAKLRDWAAERAHREGNHVHGAALHSPTEDTLFTDQGFLHFLRICPVVGGASVLFLFRTDEGARLDASHVGGQRTSEEAVRALFLIELGEHPGLHHHRG